MKKLIPILLALALAITSVIAFGTMFTGAEDPVNTVTFKPEALGTSVDNGNFKFGYFESTKGEDNKGITDFTKKHYYDAVASETKQFSYYGEMHTYSDSQNPVDEAVAKTKVGAVVRDDGSNDICLVVNSALRVPFIEFVAPASGTYSFNMFLSKSATFADVMSQDYLFRAYKGEASNETELSDYTAGNFKRANAGEPIGSGSNHSNDFTFNVTLEKGEALVLVPDSGNNVNVENWHLGVEELTATLDLATTGEYVASISSVAEIKKNETLNVDVTISNAAYNSSEIIVKYDATKLRFDNSSVGTAEAKDGVITVQNYGSSNEAGSKTTLTFTALEKTDETDIELLSAKASTAYQAEKDDLTEAFYTVKKITVKINPAEYVVTLDHIFSATTTTATEGVDFEFGVDDIGAHFNYDTVVAKIGDTDITVNGDAETGWTIPGSEITGPITVTGTRTAKTFTITFVDIDATEEGEDFGVVSPVLSATYGQPYTFTLKANQDANPETLENGWNYNLKSVVYAGEGGAAVEYTVDTENNRLVTIDGTKITADIIITVEKEILRVDEVNVTVTGDGASEVTFEAKAGIGEDYTFTLTPAEGYTYEVFYTMGADEEIKLDGTTSFTIEAVDGHITIRVTKVLTATVTTVTEYVNINGGTVYLVFVDADKLNAGNYTIAYGENAAAAMYYVNQYEGYAFLVVATGEENPTEFEYTLAIDTSREALVVEASYDVNESRNVDANDAQLVYNIYNAGVEGEMMYDGFTDRVTLVKYLRADVNNSKTVDSSDATAIVAELFK